MADKFHGLLALFWLLVTIGLVEILFFVCRNCRNANCPNCYKLIQTII